MIQDPDSPVAEDCEIRSTRIFEGSPELLFRAWTEPAHLSAWWGPKGFTNTFHEFDLRPGGRWRFTMHGPEKGHYENDCEFMVIEPYRRLTWKRHSKPLFEVLVTFEAVDKGRTRVVFRQVFQSARDCAR